MRRVAPAMIAAVGGGAGGEETAAEGAVVEKALLNGDVYRGGFSGGSPHGKGKYVWADGCMYEGEWRRGKASGKGRFSWPSGATFEGEFRGGRIEGQGVFVGPDGATYRGAWVADRRHGVGAKSYANGDYYEGQWRRNFQDGHGRYVWANGNQYVGEWRAGVLSGRGVLIWANGSRYDGVWENGVPRGTGVFTWPDGSRYVGSWPGSCLDLPAISGTFFAPVGAGPPGALRKRSSVEGVGEKATPRICIWESDGEAGDITCDIVDALEASMLYKEAAAVAGGATYVRTLPQRNTRRAASAIPRWASSAATTPESKRPGQTISKGHKNYELMLQLQLGIRHSVGKSSAVPMRALQQGDFDPGEKFWTRFPAEGSKVTLPHSTAEFRWKDYCPMVFRHLRKLFAVDTADYMLAICGNDALRELSSPGKSGSFFYLTQDDRFMIKTVKKSEVKLLIRMLNSYYKHVNRYKNSLITRFYGVHCVKPLNGQKVRFIIMGNLFCSEYQIHRRFDLKGSSYGRTADKFEDEIDETTTLKDLDLNFVFRLLRFWYTDLHEQLRRDCEFLESEGIMDYSFLVGVHFCDDISASKMGSSTFTASPKLLKKSESFQGGGTPELCFSDDDFDMIPDCRRKPLIRLGAHMPARAEQASRRSEFDPLLLTGGGFLFPNQTGEVHDVILFFGIIDILQDYSLRKRAEHAYKSLQTDPNSISAVDPKLYSKRFQDFIGRIFVEDG